MTISVSFHYTLLLVSLLASLNLNLIFSDSICDLTSTENNKVYNYKLGSPISNYPHGARSEDGFYKVAVNGTVLWFQLCDMMIFNHGQPTCLGCEGCGGSSHCGMGCSALVSNNLGGYHVCTSVGNTSSMTVELIDKRTPHAGVIVKMSSGPPYCSLSVSVICDNNELQGPRMLNRTGKCDYATQLRHPAGCATIISAHGKGMGWFGTFLTIIFCLFGAYLVVGAVYRFFFLHIRGIDIIPNLEFWASLPHTVQGLVMSLVRRFRGPSEGYRSSYSPVNF